MSDILQLAGNVFSAFGQIKKGQAEKAAAYYNADVLNEEARQEGIKASLVADNIRRAKRLMSGKQTARYAKAGVKIGTGTTLEVLADTAAQYDRDLAINEYNKKVKQAGFLKKHPQECSSLSTNHIAFNQVFNCEWLCRKSPYAHYAIAPIWRDNY